MMIKGWSNNTALFLEHQVSVGAQHLQISPLVLHHANACLPQKNMLKQQLAL